MHTLPQPAVTDHACTATDQTSDSGCRISHSGVRPPSFSSPSPGSEASDAGVGVSTQGFPRTFGLGSQQIQFLHTVAPLARASEREYGIPACVTMAQAILESATAAGWGTSPLFLAAHNPFGIKYCHLGPEDRAIGRAVDRASASTAPPPIGSAGEPGAAQPASLDAQNAPANEASAGDYGAFEAVTWEVEHGQRRRENAEFQRFPDLAEAFRYHASLLATSPRYAPARRALEGAGTGNAWREFARRLGPKVTPTDAEHCGYSTNPRYADELIALIERYRLDDPPVQQWLCGGQAVGA